MKITIRRIEYKLLCLLLIYMPFHTYICELLLKNTSYDNIVRDIVILFLFIMSVKKNRRSRHGIAVGAGIVIVLIYAFVSYIAFSNANLFNIARTYTIPILIFYVVSKNDLSEDEVINIHRIVCIELAVIALYGFFQAFFLGDDFLVRLGYDSKGGFLSSSSFYIGGFFGYQRVVGTFVSPNICGNILAIALSVLLFSDIPIIKRRKWFFVFALALGLLGTLSRSAILAFALAGMSIWVIRKLKGIQKRIKIKKILLAITASVAAVIAVILVDSFMLNHLFSRMLTSSLSGVLNMSDSSAIKHYEDLFLPVKTVLTHPFGIGFGNNGPMALAYSGSANTVESSIYLMLYEVGIVGTIIYFAPYILLILDTLKTRQYKYFAPASISVVCMIIFFLLPNIQTYEVIFYFYLFMGLYYNKSVRQYFNEREASRHTSL